MTILCWQDIPSVVHAKDANGAHKIELSQRFQELIDMVAMRRGLAGTDEYLTEWRKKRHPERAEAARDAAENVAAEIESRYDEIKAEALAGLSG